MGYSIGQVARKTGLSTYTLRFYEKEGLLPNVRKNSAGLRVFSDADLQWLQMIECLKETGMPLKGIRQYIEWFDAGDSTLSQRLEMFQKQREKVLADIAALQKHLAKIDYKVNLYAKAVRCGSLQKVLPQTKGQDITQGF